VNGLLLGLLACLLVFPWLAPCLGIADRIEMRDGG
jgi:hypothetical protein